MSIIEKLNLELAWKRVKADSKTDFIIAPYLYQIYDRFIKDNLSAIREKIVKGYHASGLWEIDVPKPHFTLRPGAVPSIDDRIYFQALIDCIAPAIEGKIVPITQGVLFSNRLSADTQDALMFKRSLWAEFDQKVRDNFYAGKSYLVVTDIAGYFEHIDLNLLRKVLLNFGCEAKIVDSIYEMLIYWKRGTGIHRGIPQGIWPSDFLGNIYLDPVDKYMLRQGYDYFRYVDDIRICCSSSSEARKALKELLGELRRLNLTVQTKKTTIHSRGGVKRYIDELTDKMQSITKEIEEIFRSDVREEILDEVMAENAADPYSEFITLPPDDIEEAVDEALEEQREAIENESLRKFYEDTVAGTFPTSKHLRFCLNRLSKLKDNIAVARVLKLLPDMPYESDVIMKYLEEFPCEESIKADLLKFLKSDLNIYDWQEMWILNYFSSCKELSGQERSYFWTIIDNHNKHDGVRIRAILLLGKHGIAEDWERLRSLYDKEKDEKLRIAIIVALRNYVKGDRNYFYSLCLGESKSIDQAITFMKELSDKK
jgi:retron-type reverse transcriptase